LACSIPTPETRPERVVRTQVLAVAPPRTVGEQFVAERAADRERKEVRPRVATGRYRHFGRK
jgi:hypothetical protein